MGVGACDVPPKKRIERGENKIGIPTFVRGFNFQNGMDLSRMGIAIPDVL